MFSYYRAILLKQKKFLAANISHDQKCWYCFLLCKPYTCRDILEFYFFAHNSHLVLSFTKKSVTYEQEMETIAY